MSEEEPVRMIRLLIFAVFSAQVSFGIPLPQEKLPSKEMVKFMKQYGYIESGPAAADAMYTEEGFRETVRQMQKFGGLPQTGEMDEATVNLTRARRCGVPDILRHNSDNRTKRYIVGSEAWRKKKLTYFLANWPPELDSALTESKLSKAFQLWSEVTPLKFQPRQSMDADLIVAFGRGSHGDGYPFDGPGGVLAHAFFPYEHDSYGGDVHFDDHEHWIDGSKADAEDGVDFFTVAAHEIGHSLGLAHSTVGSSIMFPYYKGYDQYMRLDYDDIVAMYSMYVLNANFEDESEGHVEIPEENAPVSEEPVQDDEQSDDSRIPTEEGTSEDVTEDDADTRTPKDDGYTDEDYYSATKSPTGDSNEATSDYEPGLTTSFEADFDIYEADFTQTISTSIVTTKKPAVVPNICEGNIDAASVVRGELFVFKGLYTWRLRDAGDILPGYPVHFHVFFHGFPWSVRSIDAVYQRPQDYHIVFFTGNKFWVFDGNQFTVDSPRPLTDLGLPGDLAKLDAAIVWAKNGKTYFFSNDLYWRYDETSKRIDRGYPQRIHRWKGLPPNLDAAFTWKDGMTYFFKGKDFWRFNNQNVTIDSNFPLESAPYWFGCNS